MVLRLFAVSLGLVALVWGVALLPLFWNTAAVEVVARRFIAGEAFKSEALTKLLEMHADGVTSIRPLPSAARAKAVVRLNAAELALARTDAANSDARLAEAAAAVDAALALAPADAYLWLLRYWIADTRNGFDPNRLADLAASYKLGTFEGWIAIRRNAVALRRIVQLDGAVQERVVAEFTAMVASGLVRNAVLNLAGPGWPIRERLLESLAVVDMPLKQGLVKQMSAEGFEIHIPGVPAKEVRPWR